MNIKLRLPVITLAIISLFSCTDENTVPREYPRTSIPEVTNITSSGATFIAEVTDPGNVPVSEHGFVWGSSKTLNEEYAERIYLGRFDGKGSFQADINTTLDYGRTYYVCAFIKAGDYTVYSEPVQFLSLGSEAPVAARFSPLSAAWGDTIYIHGKNFSWKTGTNIVTIGPGTVYFIFSITDTLLKCTVPEGITTKRNAVSVSIVGNKSTVKNDSLTLIYPEFTDFHPKSATWGDTIYIEGKLIGRYVKLSRSGGVYLGGIKADIFPVSDSLFKITVPNTLPTESNPISIKTYNLTYTSGTNFTLMPPVITGLSTKTSTWGAILTLFGKFNAVKTMNAVTIGGLSATITSNSATWIQVIIPASLTTVKNQVVLKSGPFNVACADSLTLQAPEIKYFTPASGISGTEVKIGGKYFRSGLTTVKFGTSDANIKSINDSVITCMVPNVAAGNYRINVKVINSNITSSSDFNVTNPVITSLSPTSVSYGDVVTVTGKNFTSGLSWTLGSNAISPTIVSPTQATFAVPYTLAYTPLQVNVSVSLNGITSTNTSSDYLSLKNFTVTSISPLTGKGGSVLTLTGTNFNTSNLSVKIGGYEATLSNVTSTGATVETGTIYNGEFDIVISSGGKPITYPSKFSVTESPWTRLNDLPFVYDYGCVFDFGEDIYVATAGTSATNREIYKFNSAINGFEKVAGTYSSQIKNPNSCVLDGYGYVIGEKPSTAGIAFERFRPDSLTWRKLPDFPGDNTGIYGLFADDTVVYAASGNCVIYTSWPVFQFYKYSPKTNKWKILAPASWMGGTGNQIFINGKILTSNRYGTLYKYNVAGNSWTSIDENFPEGYKAGKVSLELNNFWYIGFGDIYGYHLTPPIYNAGSEAPSNSFNRYDPVNNLWTSLSYIPVSARSLAMSFTSNGKIFIGGDQIYHKKDFWMYDPSKE